MPDLMRVNHEVLARVQAMLRDARAAGFRSTITSGYRTVAEQRRLYEARQRGEHPLPVAPPGCSEHNWGVAVDLVTEIPARELEAVARYYGLRWAGPADPVHFGVFSGAEWRSLRGQLRLC